MTKQEKLAVILYELCELRFSRRWSDVPRECQDYWRDISKDVINAMKNEHWTPR